MSDLAHKIDDAFYPQEQDNSAPVRAKLKWFNGPKGFGFVVPVDEELDAFLHVTTLQRAGINTIGEGADIMCRIRRGPKGAMVTEVTQILNCGDIPDMVMMQISRAQQEQDNYAHIEMKGVVKWFKPEKGFGFIIPEDGGKDVFIHKACLEKHALPPLECGQTVRMTVRNVAKGREAVAITLD
ncbi:MAG: cold shock domain-containing protein [Micavibrio aeruginosavorus]|nr:cold shock domain-containing protein [Micavibrio aeruginosavorus]